MRDPKTHAKVLALRWNRMYDEEPSTEGEERRSRLLILRERVAGAVGDHQDRTGWLYCVWLSPPVWKHNTEIIPDTEEDA